jgi:hypothetical protein
MLPVGPRPGARGGLEVRNGSRLFIGRCRAPGTGGERGAFGPNGCIEVTAVTGLPA